MRLFVLSVTLAAICVAADVPPQAARGKEIFLHSKKGTECAACHRMENQGNAIAPDLTRIARISARAFSISVLSTRTVYTKEIKLKSVATIPALMVSEDKESLKFYDLTKVPPELRELKKSEIHAVNDNTKWRHPPEYSGYTDQELADVIAYIRWASFGDTKGVEPGELK